MYANDKLVDAAEATMAEVGKLGGDGGVIGVDRTGKVVFAFNSGGMFRAFAHAGGSSGVFMFGEEGGGKKVEY
jgi:isoaspartyl peptidase/L-asparaginase-like protein (Ntn-hydrolase superfamily)